MRKIQISKSKFQIFAQKTICLLKNIQPSSNKESGQVALIVLLISAVVMTLGLSLSRKTVVETKIDTDEELLRQAFDAAESGVDYYMATQQDKFATSNVGTSVEAQVTVNEIGNTSAINFDEYTLSGQSTVFWLVSHDTNGDIGTTYYGGTYVNICVDNPFNGSLKIDYYYQLGAAYRVDRLAHNFGVAPQVITNAANLPQVVCQDGRKGVRVTLRAGVNQLLLAATPLFEGARVTVEGNSNFPSQGFELVSTGFAGRDVASGISGVSRIVKVSNRYRVPGFMLDAVSSGRSVMSN